jgi:hypothetical protein
LRKAWVTFPSGGALQKGNVMQSQVGSSAQLYFRCIRLAATISPRQCRSNRDRCSELSSLIEQLPAWQTGEPFACLDCPQAPRVDSGHVRCFTDSEVVAGLARADVPPATRLPWEHRESARPSDNQSFTSAFWLPEWDF